MYLILQETVPYFSCNGDTCPQYFIDIPIGQTGADFLWQLHSGATQTQNTGPDTGRGGSGKFRIGLLLIQNVWIKTNLH